MIGKRIFLTANGKDAHLTIDERFRIKIGFLDLDGNIELCRRNLEIRCAVENLLDQLTQIATYCSHERFTWHRDADRS